MPSEPRLSLAVIRAAAKKHADATSLRSAAADIGLSFTGFRAFLVGGKPRHKTRTRLVTWYAEHRKPKQRAARGLTVADAELGATLVGLYIKQDAREDGRDRKLVGLIKQIGADGAVSPEMMSRITALAK